MDLERKATSIANIKSKQGLRDKFIYDSRKQKVASVAFRENLLESQVRVNYVNEFGRLKGHLYANRNLPATTKAHLENRMKNYKIWRNSHYMVNTICIRTMVMIIKKDL